MQVYEQNDCWEVLGERTYRLKVPNGWIYRFGHQSHGFTPIMVFVPENECRGRDTTWSTRD